MSYTIQVQLASRMLDSKDKGNLDSKSISHCTCLAYR